jgi:hypothetical protein
VTTAERLRHAVTTCARKTPAELDWDEAETFGPDHARDDVKLPFGGERTGISIREFHRRMGPDGRNVPGSSYPNIHRYLSEKPQQRLEPTLEFLRHAAEVCEVREEWLIAGAGLPTEEQEQASAHSKRRRDGADTRVLATTGFITDALGRPRRTYRHELGTVESGKRSLEEREAPAEPPSSRVWSAPANDLVLRWWENATIRATAAEQDVPEFDQAVEAVAEAISAPLKALGIGWNDLTDRERDSYVLSIVAVLFNSLGRVPLTWEDTNG